MTERARTITAERLSDRLPVHNPDNEMGRLATVFNETLGRLEASFEQMRRFTGDVSHELRTPLTAIRSVGEVGLREHRDEPAYRAIIGSMLEEVDRLSGLVDRLLTLSRAESGQAKLSVEVVDLRELAEEVVGHLGVLAEEKRQTITVDVVGRAARSRRSAGAAAVADQSGRQRDQVHAGRAARSIFACPTRRPVRRSTCATPARALPRRCGRGFSIATIAAGTHGRTASADRGSAWRSRNGRSR